MKKITLLPMMMALLFSHFATAQFEQVENSAKSFSDTVKSIFPLVLGAIFLIGFLFNAGYFFGENADVKKGITRLIVFVAVAGAVAGIFTYLISIKL